MSEKIHLVNIGGGVGSEQMLLVNVGGGVGSEQMLVVNIGGGAGFEQILLVNNDGGVGFGQMLLVNIDGGVASEQMLLVNIGGGVGFEQMLLVNVGSDVCFEQTLLVNVGGGAGFLAIRFVDKTALALGAGISKSPYGAQRHRCADHLWARYRRGCRVAANGDLEIPAPIRFLALSQNRTGTVGSEQTLLVNVVGGAGFLAIQFVDKIALALGAGISKSPYGAERHRCAHHLWDRYRRGCCVAANGDLEIPAPIRFLALSQNRTGTVGPEQMLFGNRLRGVAAMDGTEGTRRT